MTRSLPRRAPYELKFSTATPRSISSLPAGDEGWMLPAGLMWSVVTLSPKIASGRAQAMIVGGVGSTENFSN